MDGVSMINIDFDKLTFDYTKTKSCYISYYKDGKWDEGKLTTDDMITISAFSPALHYAQQCFEGMKAYKTKDGSIQLFRPEENAKRMQASCHRLLIPEIPITKFIEAVKMTVLDNLEYIPPYESKAKLYIRPVVFGTGYNLGIRAAREYIFMVLVTPVGPYFKEGIKPVKFMVSDYDRAAPHGTGDIKVGGNYAASLYPQTVARNEGFADCIYLDPATHTKIEEVGAANFFGITKDNEFVTPKSSSVLPGITKKSLMYLAREQLGMKVLEEDVYIDQLERFVEAGACGTAAVISPIGGIYYKDKIHVFYSETEVGPICQKLYDLLTKIQVGDIKAPEGWIYRIK